MSSEATGAPGAKRPTVFLSYSHADQAPAHRLAAALQAAGCEVWWDTLIEGGAAFAKSIEAALEASDAVVVLWSKASTASDWVLDEAARARDLKKLVPLSLDGGEPPLGFRQYQAIDVRAFRGGADDPVLAAIRRAVDAAAARERSPRGAPLRPSGAPASGSRRVLLFGGIALALGAGGGLVAWQWRGGGGARAGGNSVAVLPFDNLSGDPQQAYFSDGLSEEVRATLARNHALRVMAQSSSNRFRDAPGGAKEIARELGVAFLLDGSVRRAGNEVRVTAELVEGETGISAWTQVFERQLDDVFAVQEGIAAAVAMALAQAVGGAAPAPEVPVAQATGGTTDVAAFDAYLRGRALYDLSADEASERQALAQFDAAIARDAGYAAAHAARARSLTAIANQYGKPGETTAMYDAAIAAARRAIELAPDLADAHSTLGFTLFQGKLDAAAAREPFERSAQLGAGEATVLARFAQYAARCGREADAAAAMQRAIERDALNPLIHRAAGSIEYAARRYAASLAPLDRALAMNPRMSRAHAMRGDALLNLGRIEEARAAYAAEPTSDFRLAGLALIAQRANDLAAARSTLGELIAAEGDRVRYQQAQVLAQLGDLPGALDALERARTLGDSGLIYARNDPFLDPLRAEPRMQRLLAGVGFA
jgi:TolB-like protein/predicted negative regulator of RcsB-dependent stress response